MYKVKISVLDGLKKQLEANNKILASVTFTPAVAKAMKGNNSQIKLLVEEFYIN